MEPVLLLLLQMHHIDLQNINHKLYNEMLHSVYLTKFEKTKHNFKQ